ncbi:MAG: DNRLRE domain-containing protein [Candidatus Coatesbacteria bacterium]|nr:MAG: DNRLRE domain-containing protein [Candidatus Coatesbacteria bacterium]
MNRIVLLAPAVLLAAGFAFATTNVTFQPDGAASMDAMIRSAEPDTNYGNLSYISVGVEPGQTSAASLIKFTGLDPYVGATLSYAELNLYCYDRWFDVSYPGFGFLRTAGAWTEDGVTWNNNPNADYNMDVVFTIPDADGWMTADVTSLVETWLDGTFPHNGFFISVTAGGDVVGGGYFYSGEYADDPGLRPYLYMEYSYTGIEPASLGSVKAVFR